MELNEKALWWLSTLAGELGALVAGPEESGRPAWVSASATAAVAGPRRFFCSRAGAAVIADTATRYR
jgi:hypothetical protein